MQSTTRNMVWIFGFISGFNLLITSNSLNFWLAREGINLKVIGFFALVSIPYAINFLWAPIIDHISLGKLGQKLGQRISWCMVLLGCSAISTFVLSFIDPLLNINLIAAIACITAFLTSSADTVLGAIRSEQLKAHEHGPAAGTYIVGYRLGMLLSSSGAIYLSSLIGWNMVYKLFALMLCMFTVVIYCFRNHIHNNNALVPENQELKTSPSFVIGTILTPMGSSLFITVLVIFLILYRIPDNFISTMVNPFVLYIGFNEQEIAMAGKFWGIIGSILGGLFAGYLMQKWSVYTSLLRFGAIHALAHLSYILLHMFGNDLTIFFIVTGFESITGGMAMAAYIALITSLCRGKYRATQYSFLSSMMGLSRSILPSISGILVMNYGWNMFFLLSSFITLPALLFIIPLRKLAAEEK